MDRDQELGSGSPATRTIQERAPQPRARSSEWDERTRALQGPGTESPSPPLRDTVTWSAIRTDVSRERTIAALPRRAEVNPGSAMRMEQDRQANGEESGAAASPDIGMAISALESLSDERNYQPRHPMPRRDDDADVDANLSSTFEARETSPRRSLALQVEASRPSVLSMPASSRNSDDGIDTACHDSNGLTQGIAGVRIDRQTQDRLLAIYWTHIHVSRLLATSHRIVLTSPLRMCGHYFINQNSTHPPSIDPSYLPCWPPHQLSRRRERRSSTRRRRNSCLNKPSKLCSVVPPVPQAQHRKEINFTRLPRRNRACKRYNA